MLTLISLGLSLGLSLSGSCAALCTPVLVSYIAAAEHPTIFRGLYSSILFSLGRLISCTTLGLLFGSVISSVEISPTITTASTLILGCLVILHGLSALGIFKMRTFIGPSICKYVGTNRSPIYLGMLTGLRPCVPLIAVLTYSITLSGFTEVLLFMLSFWLGSSLLFLLIGPISGGLAGAASKKLTAERVRRISGIAMVVVGLFFVAQAAGLIIYQPGL